MMKRTLCALLCAGLLAGCAAPVSGGNGAETVAAAQTAAAVAVACPEGAVEILLADDGIRVDGGGETETVYTSRDIQYYEDRDSYESGYPYGEGAASDRHSEKEAQAHTVVNITAPGRYFLKGSLSRGQIRVDLGSDAKDDPAAVVELILGGVEMTCTVAPVVLFQNVYECGDSSAENAGPTVDTSAAGAVLTLAEGSVNILSGSHVAKIYKDAEGEKKLIKQDGAVYSYMSMNICGDGALDVNADNEGVDSELHLTINGGNIRIRSMDDGINTNEDGVSVTTINGGNVHIIAGLGKEGDGIDSNGYLVINGGTVVAAANPASDSGLDSDCGSYIHGGTVVALGSTMDWAESESNQVTMNLQFAQYQTADSAIVVKDEAGEIVFAYDPGEDEVLAQNARSFSGAIISCPQLQVGQHYTLWLDGTVEGSEVGGFYDLSSIRDYWDGRQQQFTGSDLRRGPGGFGGQRPDGQRPEMPEGGFGGDGQRPEKPEGFGGQRPEMPEGGFRGEGSFPGEGERPQMPEGGFPGDGERPEGFPGTPENGSETAPSTDFYMQDKVNAFSGVGRSA